jgi:hypothetical protein
MKTNTDLKMLSRPWKPVPAASGAMVVRHLTVDKAADKRM